MNARRIYGAAICAFAAMTVFAQAPALSSPGPEMPQADELLREIRKLRQDIFEARSERAADFLAALQKRAGEIRAEWSRLEDEERLAAEQVRLLDAHLLGTTATPDEKTHVEAMRAAIAGGETERRRAVRMAELKGQEKDVGNQLRKAEHELREMQGKHTR